MIGFKYKGIEQLKELDKIPGLVWASRDAPSKYDPKDTDAFVTLNQYKNLYCYYDEVTEVSLDEFIRQTRKTLGILWEQSDL